MSSPQDEAESYFTSLDYAYERFHGGDYSEMIVDHCDLCRTRHAQLISSRNRYLIGKIKHRCRVVVALSLIAMLAACLIGDLQAIGFVWLVIYAIANEYIDDQKDKQRELENWRLPAPAIVVSKDSQSTVIPCSTHVPQPPP